MRKLHGEIISFIESNIPKILNAVLETLNRAKNVPNKSLFLVSEEAGELDFDLSHALTLMQMLQGDEEVNRALKMAINEFNKKEDSHSFVLGVVSVSLIRMMQMDKENVIESLVEAIEDNMGLKYSANVQDAIKIEADSFGGSKVWVYSYVNVSGHYILGGDSPSFEPEKTPYSKAFR